MSDKLKKFIISNKKKNIKLNFIYNKRKYSIESSRGEFYINIAIISFLFIKKFIKTIKFKNFFYDESIIESRGKEVLTYIGIKKN